LISAINRDDETTALEMVKLLVQHGADANRKFRWYDDEKMPAFSAIEWAIEKDRPEIASYLRSQPAE